ncbi:MAG TPA: hypothetical protein PKH94_02975 [Bacteroidales bacterium]|nr:hypothetical protein [Bacteroidales bacterium]HNS46178.1 hypothetical protein [Bacteroidales bacterium]
MKNLVLCGLISICLAACTSTTEKKHAENIDIVKSYVQSVEEMDFNAMDEFLADDYLGMGPSYGDSIRKKEAVENWKENVTNLYEKIHYNRSRFAAVTIPEGDNKGEWVANWAELNIVYKNDRGSVTILANTNYLLENGKIAKSLTFYNEADALRQLGYAIVSPGDGE